MQRTIECKNWKVMYEEESGRIVGLKKGERTAFFQEEPLLTFFTGGICLHNNQEQMSELEGCEELGRDTRFLHAEIEKEDSGEVLALAVQMGKDWTLTNRFWFETDQVRQKCMVTYEGEEEVKMRYACWTTDSVEEADYGRCEVLAPGYQPPLYEPLKPFQSLAEYKSKDLLVTGAEPYPVFFSGLTGTYDREQACADMAWFVSEYFPARLMGFSRNRQSGRLRRTVHVYCPRYFRKGDSQEIGEFYYGIFEGTRLDAIRAASASYKKIWSREIDYPKERNFKIMEVTIGEKLMLSPFPDFQALIEKLPEIKKMGFNVIEVMPRFPFPGYSVFNWRDIDTTYGSEEGLRRMIQEAHKLGIRVILDVVLHGPYEYDSKAVGLPDSPHTTQGVPWYAKHESGKDARTYSHSFDMSHPAYVSYLIETLLGYIENLKTDGFRFDAQHWNMFPNWDRNSGRMPYEQMLAGIRMTDRIREEVCGRYPDTVFYTETNGSMVSKSHSYRYNYDLYWALWGALAPVEDVRSGYSLFFNYIMENTLTWPDYIKWYEELRASMPEGVVLVNHIDSHDYHERTRYIGGQYSREVYGTDIHRVFVGMTAFMDCGFMSYYGAQVGNEEYYGRILNLREKDEIFNKGTCMLTQACADDPKTVTLLWKYQEKWALFVGNLERKEKTVKISVKEETDRCTVWDLCTGSQAFENLLACGEDGMTLKLKGADCLMVRSENAGGMSCEPVLEK
ncbi:MAG: alpha-amylase family glycosyl hydrolase [Eubacteriales bacterium]|nr:alpha-amylase family glycosyl hydrolase [Eubacteriales bacterium]